MPPSASADRERASRARRPRFIDRSSRRPRFRNRQPWPRVMFSISMPLNAARSVIDAVQVDEHLLELDAALPQTHVLLQLVQDPPGIDRQPIAHGAGEPPHLVERIAEAGVRALPGDELDRVLFELAQPGVSAELFGKQPQPDEHPQQRRHLSRVVGRVLIGETRDEAAQQSDDVFRAFDVAAEPEEILGDAARQLGGRRVRAWIGSAAPAASPGSPDRRRAPTCPCSYRRAASRRSGRPRVLDARVRPPGITVNESPAAAT